MSKRFYDQEIIISNKLEDIKKASKLILSGVGSYDFAMNKLHSLKLIPTLEQKAIHEKTPLLGICLGMQLLTTSSEEGSEKGLNWIPGKASHFKHYIDKTLKTPHMGWNTVNVINKSSLVDGFDNSFRYYFVHSYRVKVDNPEHRLLECTYDKPFDAAIYKDNIYGVQFHPEKSHKYGFKLLSNFLNLC